MECIKCKKEIPDGAPFCCWCGKKQEARRNRTRGNGQGNAYQRGKTWTARWTEKTYLDENDKLHQKMKTKGGFTSKRAALQYAANPPKEERRSPTLRAYYKTYLRGDYLSLSANRQGAAEKAFERMKELADCEIDTLTISQIQDVVDHNASTYYTRKDMKTVLSHCYNLAIAEKQTTVNLAEYIKLPELDEKSPEPFTGADVKKLWEAYAKDHFVGFILTMIYTGMMPGELLKLKKDMIDFEKNEIVRGGIKTKKRKETPMVFPDFVAPVLRELCEESKSKVGNVCCINKDNFYKRYYECLELAGARKLPPYSCRHTTATALAIKNIDLFTIKEIMRHTKITTTQRYVHPDMRGMVDAVNQLQGDEKTGEFPAITGSL